MRWRRWWCRNGRAPGSCFLATKVSLEDVGSTGEIQSLCGPHRICRPLPFPAFMLFRRGFCARSTKKESSRSFQHIFGLPKKASESWHFERMSIPGGIWAGWTNCGRQTPKHVERLLRRRGFTHKTEGFHNRVVDGGADFGDLMILAGGMDSVRQQHYKQLAIRIDPNRGSRKTRVAVTVGREIVSAGTVFGWDNPSQGAGVFS